MSCHRVVALASMVVMLAVTPASLTAQTATAVPAPAKPAVAAKAPPPAPPPALPATLPKPAVPLAPGSWVYRATIEGGLTTMWVVKDGRRVAKFVGVRPQLQGATLTSELMK